jgi:rare lipoprotein A
MFKFNDYFPKAGPYFFPGTTRIFSRIAFSVLFLAGAATAQTGQSQTGTASYYAEEFHGRLTASGEVYDMNAFTAAHRTHPFNTMLKVTNLASGATVVVRVNDEGPFVEGRIIDLSRAAAKKLGMLGSGTARVKLDVVSAPAKREFEDEFFSIKTERAQLSGYAVQVASFSDMANMLKLLDRIRSKGINDVYVRLGWLNGQALHRIVTKGFPTRGEAEKQLSALRKQGLDGFVFKIR